MLIGYARVSKAASSQSLDLQRDALQASTPSTPTTTLRPAYATTAQSRLTRPKAATRRLLSLDYIIERPTLGWLQTENEKVPYRTYSEGKQVQKRFFTMKFPVAVDAKAATFAYVDPGLTTEPHSPRRPRAVSPSCRVARLHRRIPSRRSGNGRVQSAHTRGASYSSASNRK